MKKTIILLSTLCSLYAAEITITDEQKKDWQISVSMPTASTLTPKATLFTDVVTPPQLLKTLSLPNDVTITNLHVNLYDTVKRGDALVDVSSSQWLEAQKDAVAMSINVDDVAQAHNRKQKLCDEQIIAQKECIASRAELLKAQNALKASKELLLAFGAKPAMIDAITNRYKVYATLTIYSSSNGSIIQNNTAIGKSFAAYEPLLTIKEDGNLWIEGAMSNTDAMTLHEGEPVTIAINNVMIESKILNIAPVINAQNQTRNIRLSAAESATLLSGLRASATLYLHHDSLKVPQKAVIQDGEKSIVYIQQDQHYSSVAVTILAQEGDYYYVEPLEALENPIVVTSVAILKSMMDSQHE